MSTKLSNDELDAAYAAVAALKGKISDSALEELYAKLAFDESQREAELEAKVEERLKKQIAEEYELDPYELKPSFIVESDLQITIGQGEHERTINMRYLNIADFEEIAGLIPDITRVLFGKGPNLLSQLSSAQFLNAVLGAALGPDKRYGRLRARVYEVIASCLSNPSTDQIVTASYLRGCVPSQLKEAVISLYQVNHDFFHDLWAEVPGPIRSMLATSIGGITNDIKGIVLTIAELGGSLNGFGGIPNGGLTNGLTPSPVNTVSANLTSSNSRLSAHGDTARQSAAAKPVRGMQSGSRTKTPRKATRALASGKVSV